MIDLFFMLIFPPPPGSHVGIKTDYQFVYIQPGIFLDSPSVFRYDGAFTTAKKNQ